MLLSVDALLRVRAEAEQQRTLLEEDTRRRHAAAMVERKSRDAAQEEIRRRERAEDDRATRRETDRAYRRAGREESNGAALRGIVPVFFLIAAVAAMFGLFTRPGEAGMQEAAAAVLSDPSNVSEGLESLGATIAGDRTYSNYYVAAKYTVTLDGTPVVNCWGAFTQVQCTRTAGTGG